MSAPQAPPASGERSASPRGAAGAIRWLLAAQVLLAVLMAGGDLLERLPGLLIAPGAAPSLRMPIQPGDQIRRYSPRDAPSSPGFPGDTAVPPRLAWEARSFDGAPAIVLSGEIRTGDAERFLAHLDGLAEAPATILLHSPGGSVADALAIGRRLRAEGLATRVEPGAACFSACPYLLAGGVTRSVSRTAMVGVHQHYFGESTVLPAFLAVEDIQRGQAEVMAYLDAMGIDPMLMEKAMQTPPKDIYLLLADELARFALATEMTD